jgi:hypothetical protein
MQPKKLSLKPDARSTGLLENASAWVENRNGIDAGTPSVQIEGANCEKQPALMKVKRITFEVSEARHQTAKIRATQKGMTIKEWMSFLLDQELERGL